MEARIPESEQAMESNVDQIGPMQDVSTRLSQDEETALVKAALQDPAAFAGLYRRYVRPVYRYFYSRSGAAADAEDLTAQVFLEAFEGLRRYREDGPFTAWLFTIARRRAIDALRRRRPVTALDEQVQATDPSADPLAQAIRDEQSGELKASLAGVTETDRELLRLRFAAGLGFGEMARILRRSEAAVKMNLYRLLRRLESELESSHE
jgi:RNA polymerase sigma-70 factor (ECF subfamily)